MTDDCQHLTIIAKGSDWHCVVCNEIFLPRDSVETLVNEKIDLAVGIASAMLWDFHVRAAEKYGPEVAETVSASEGYQHTPETCPDHEFRDGACTLCGTSLFLGGGVDG